jgi:hypothetical protein
MGAQNGAMTPSSQSVLPNSEQQELGQRGHGPSFWTPQQQEWMPHGELSFGELYLFVI